MNQPQIKYAPGEDQQTEENRHIRQGHLLATLVQKPRDAQFGKGRGMHRRQVLGLEARFEVTSGINALPANAKVGLFAKPASYETIVRLSNGSPTPNFNDFMPDIRGFAFKITVDPGAAESGVQDFVLINQETQFVPTSDEFVAAVLALVQHGRTLGSLIYILEHPSKAVRRFKYIQTFRQFLAKRFTGFSSESFFSATPIRCGQKTAMRVALRPQSRSQGCEPPLHLDQDMLARLEPTDLVYTFEIQLFEREETTPIEDASINWTTTYYPVATLTLTKRQVPVEKLAFDPFTHLPEHEPMGEMMRARRHAYKASRAARK